MIDFSSSRYFRVWNFFVGHTQLLIRSRKTEHEGENENLDLIFKGVFYMELPDAFQGIAFEHPTSEELNYLQKRSQVNQDSTHIFYKLRSNDSSYYIGAAFVEVDINNLEHLETHLDHSVVPKFGRIL